jgi:hypothetical protein
LLLFAIDIQESNPSWNKEFATILSVVKLKNMEVIFVTASPESIKSYLGKNELNEQVRVLTCDLTAIRTAARANPTLYLLKKGIIINKWAYADFENAIGEINSLPVRESE